MNTSSVLLAILLIVTLAGCDQMENVASGANGSEPQTNIAKKEDGEPQNVPPSKVRLNAFQDFNCTKNWGNRDGGLGLKAGSGSGSCKTTFPGQAGEYRVILMAQLEFDGGPKFRLSIDGKTIAAGEYPMSKGKLICDCPNWRVNCPDRVVPIDAGVHSLKQGSIVEFYGEEVYPCGSGSHGAYAKWRELVFTPS